MTWRKRSFVVALALGMTPVWVGGVAGAQFVPIGGEIRANEYTADSQTHAAVSISPNGEFVIVWQSAGQDGDENGIFLRQFEGDGAFLGGEIQVNTTTAGDQSQPAIDMASEGDFVVVWQSGQITVSDIFGRRFDAAGQAIGGEFQVNSYTGSDWERAVVGVRGDGAFVVAWEGDGPTGSLEVFARRFDAAGTPLATQFLVHAYTTGAQLDPAIDVETDGDFVVAWRGDDGASADNVWARRFTSSGTGQGVEFRVGASGTAFQDYPDLAIAPDSSFVITWRKDPGDGSGPGIVARRFAASGTPLAMEFLVNSYTADDQANPSIAIEADGDFVIAWDSAQPPQSFRDVFAQRFRASGAREGGEFHVNADLVNTQYRPAIAADPARSAMVIAWEGFGGHDAIGVFAQRYGGTNVDIDGNGAVDALSDGLLFVRYLFGFRGAALTTGAVAGNCTRCTAEQIEAFIDGLL